MNQILPYSLWVGHAGDGRDFRKILDAGIKAIVQVAIDEPPLQPPRELIYRRFPLLDGLDNPREVLALAITIPARMVRAHVPMLICCGAGMSRAPLIAGAALSVAQGEPLESSMQQVASCHHCDVSPGLWSEVRALVAKLGA